ARSRSPQGRLSRSDRAGRPRIIPAVDALPGHVRLVIFDLDGVIYRGAEPIPGAPELVAWLREPAVAVRCGTNHPLAGRAGYVERLGAMGISTRLEEIVTSTSATIEHLRRHAPRIRSILAIGADGMREELRSAGYELTMAGEAPPAEQVGGPLGRRYDA